MAAPLAQARLDGRDRRWNLRLKNGLDVRLTVTAAQTDGNVLVVPVSAVSAAADGDTTVTVQDATGRLRRVGVQAGESGDGFVAVSPVEAGTLKAGDRVVVGQ